MFLFAEPYLFLRALYFLYRRWQFWKLGAHLENQF